MQSSGITDTRDFPGMCRVYVHVHALLCARVIWDAQNMANTATVGEANSAQVDAIARTASSADKEASPHPDPAADAKRANGIYPQRPRGFKGIFGEVEDFHAGLDKLNGRPLLSGGLSFWKDIEAQMELEFVGYVYICACTH